MCPSGTRIDAHSTAPALHPWQLVQADPDAIREVQLATSLSPVSAKLLVARGHLEGPEANEHLLARPSGLHDPELLPGMGPACERLALAIDRGETLLVHGDYDVDGVTGTSLLMRLFRLIGAKAEWHIPNRFTDGYSFGAHSLERAEATGASVVISVDNGTSAFETISALKERGVDTIVTDHHEPPPGELPPAVAIINPKLNDSTYPWRELCGGAVAFKLAWGLCQRISGARRVREDLKQFLEDAMAYVAIATVCDVVPLTGENRIFARFGLRALSSTQNHGLRALCDVAGLTGRSLTGEDVGFQIGPRINASGRMGSAERAVECLLAEDEETAKRLARELDELNQERKAIERGVLDQAIADAETYSDEEQYPVIVVAGQGWHQGVVGIVAARLVDKYARPALVIGLDGESGRGSGRAPDGFDLLTVLRGGADHFERFGGHAQAAGCEIRADAVDAMREAVCTHARTLDRGPSETPLVVDCELALPDMNPQLMRELDRLEPFGAQNTKPLFLSRAVRLGQPARRVGATGDHLVVELREGAHSIKAVAFGQGPRAEQLPMGAPIHVVYSPKWNTFRGQTKLELELLDFQVGGDPQV